LFDANPMFGFGAHTAPPPQEPASAAAGIPHKRAMPPYAAGVMSVVAEGAHDPPDASELPIT